MHRNCAHVRLGHPLCVLAWKQGGAGSTDLTHVYCTPPLSPVLQDVTYCPYPQLDLGYGQCKPRGPNLLWICPLGACSAVSCPNCSRFECPVIIAWRRKVRAPWLLQGVSESVCCLLWAQLGHQGRLTQRPLGSAWSPGKARGSRLEALGSQHASAGLGSLQRSAPCTRDAHPALLSYNPCYNHPQSGVEWCSVRCSVQNQTIHNLRP